MKSLKEWIAGSAWVTARGPAIFCLFGFKFVY